MAEVDFKSPLIKEWMNHYQGLMTTMYPEVDEKDTKKFLKGLVEKNLVNREAILHNNYASRKLNVDLLGVINMIEKNKPIVAGFGMFYKNQHNSINPNAVMLQNFLSLRKQYKKQLHHLEPGSFEYQTMDRLQLTEKINANSYYGCSGAGISRFFNIYTAASVTLTGQSLISTAAQAFEAFLANNNPFYDLDNCFEFLEKIRDEKVYIKESSVLPNVTVDAVFERLRGMFYKYREEFDYPIFRYLMNLPQRVLNRIYFKNNLYEFSKLPEIEARTLEVIRNVEEFKDPNSVPEAVQSELADLWQLYGQFVFYNHSPFGRIDRLRNDVRKAVVVVDTDSNMLNLNDWVEYIQGLSSTDSELANRDYDNIRFIAVNIMCYYLTQMINAVLWRYTKRANVPKEYRKNINMKNEFLFTKLITIDKKKRYIASIRLREGSEIYPEKLDIKGLDFMKSTTREETQNYFKGMIKNHLIEHPSANIKGIYKDLFDFEQSIRDSINNGEKNFLSPAKVKNFDTYEFPLRIPGVRGVMAWNSAFPSRQVSLPDKVDLIKVNMENLEDIAELEGAYPEIYHNLRKGIYENRNEEVRKKGITVFALPRTEEVIPDWIRPYVDTSTIINDNASRFNAVLTSLGMDTMTMGTRTYYTNIKKLG